MKYLLSILLILTCFLCEAQTIQHKATHRAFRTSDAFTEKWGPWTDWEKCDILITINVQWQTLAIHESIKQIYELTEVVEQKVVDNRDVIVFNALDPDNVMCIIELVHYDTGKEQIYIRWKNFQLTYEIIRI